MCCLLKTHFIKYETIDKLTKSGEREREDMQAKAFKRSSRDN